MQVANSYSQIIKIAAPISLSLLIPQVSFMANAAFLGHLGTYELEVNSLCSIYYLLITWIGFGLSNGVMVIISRQFGEQNRQAAAMVFGNAVVLAVIISLLMMALTFFIAPTIFSLTLYDTKVIIGCNTFLNIRIIGLPFLMLTQLMNAYFISSGQSKRIVTASLMANAVAVLFDYSLIFGKFGLPALGLNGAAIASVAGEVVYMLSICAIFFLRKKQRPFPFYQFLSLKKSIIIHIFKVSLPLVFQYVFSIGGWLLFFVYVEHLGSLQLATSHILRSVLGITSIGTWALASTCNTMVSNLIGQGRQKEVLLLVRKILIVSIAYAAFFSVLLNCFPQQFFAIYTDNPEIVQMGMPPLRLLSFSILILSLATVCFNAVVGSGKTTINMLIEIFCVLSYALYVTIVIERNRASLQWAWASEFVYWGLLLLLSSWYLLRKYGSYRAAQKLS